MTTYTLTEAQRQQMIEALDIAYQTCCDQNMGLIDASRTALQSLEPVKGEAVAYITETDQGPMVWTPEMYGEACTYCDDGEFPVPLYTHPLRELTDEEVEAVAITTASIVWPETGYVGWTDDDKVFFPKFARAVLKKAKE